MRLPRSATGATVLLFGLVAGLIPATPSTTGAGVGHAEANGDVIVHLFQWRWESVANECADVLGPAGYGAAQVSPPQEHVVLPRDGHPWWQDYQPVSYRVDNTRRGTRHDFVEMVRTCREHGVKIYADAVINHMTGAGSVGSGRGSADGEFSKYEYPEVPYRDEHFSDCRRSIVDWDDPEQVWHCELLSLSDLRTDSPYVRERIAAFLNDLIAIGVAGFRVDAAKHMPPADLAAIYAMLDDVPGFGGRPYVFQEVIEGGGPPSLRPPAYADLGDVTDFRYHRRVGPAVRSGRLAGLPDLLARRMALPGAQAVVFIDNHDTQREERSISFQEMGAAHHLAQAFMLAHPYGAPKVMSSYRFETRAQGPPSTGVRPDNPAGDLTAPADCDTGEWLCEHRAVAVAGMVSFRNHVGDAPVTDVWTSDDGRALGFGRGEAGFALFNRGDALTGVTLRTSLPPGTYCDVASGSSSRGDGCTGAAYDVSNEGTVRVTLAPDSVIALHRGEMA
jgi:alpha-amylase